MNTSQLIAQFTAPLDIAGTFVALLCGGIIGLERQLRGRPAGIRTSMLICLGAQTFVQLGSLMAGPSNDPSRVLGQIVTGIGFLGAGVILSKGGLIYGVTSAAAIWMLAAIGSAIGLGFHLPAISLTVVTITVLVVLDLLETKIEGLRRGVHAQPQIIQSQLIDDSDNRDSGRE